MITIGRIVADNFMQYDRMEFNVSSGMWLISGKNRTGKSSIVEALLWCLYGETIRGTNTQNVLKRNKSKVSVTVTGHVKTNKVYVFYVTRTYNGTSTSLEVNVDGTDHDYGTRQLTQAWLEKFLMADFRTFSSIVLFGHNSFRFTQAKDSERKELLERMLPQIAQCEVARTFAAKKVQETASQLAAIQMAIDVHKETVRSMQERTVKHASDAIQQLEKEISAHGMRIRKLLANAPEETLSARELAQKMGEIQGNVQRLESIIERIKNLRVCVTCGRDMTPAVKKDILKKYSDELVIANSEYSKYNNMQNKARKYDEHRRAVESAQEMLADAEEKLYQLKSGKTVAQTAVKAEIMKHKRAVAKLEANAVDIERDRAKYVFWSKGFSKSGVVSLIIDGVIDQLNAHANEVAMQMTDGLFTVEFSSVTQSKSGNAQERISFTVTVDGELSPYENLSNSERQRVDMIVMFAWHRFVSDGAVDVNVAFFDEVIEGLDEMSAAAVMRYVDATRRDRATYAITHALELAAFKSDGIIKITRDKNGSHIQEAV